MGWRKLKKRGTKMMTKLQEGLKEYQRKLKEGEVTRLTPIEKSFAKPNSLRYALNAKCFDCSCGDRKEITFCEITTCPLHRFRPYKKKEE